MGKRYLDDCTIFAVDFDGTLCRHSYPEIGEPNIPLIEWLIKRRQQGDKVILWTTRVRPYLDAAVGWCAKQGLFFDAVNENIPEIMEMFKDVLNGQAPSPKVTADIYIDDAACSGLECMEKGSCCLGCPVKRP